MTLRSCSAVLVLCLSAGAPGQQPSALGAIVDAYHRENLFHGTVLVTHRGRRVLARAVGIRDVESGTPHELDTRFPIGSITKPFVAVLTMQAVERGELDLGQRVARYLPSYRRDHGDRITLEHLLDHTSGIPYTMPVDQVPATHYSRRQLLEALNQSGPLVHEPGARYRYCNTGYRLLGMILEDLGDGDYPDVVRSGILTPLGLRDTGVIDGSVADANRRRDCALRTAS